MVKLVEAPRLAWQDLPGTIPAEVKADYLRVVIAAGFEVVDASAFVGKTASPQMADSERVLAYLDPPDEVELIALVVDAEGAERALKTQAIATLAFPYSLSPAFEQKARGRSAEEALEALEAIGTAAYKGGGELLAYVSMAFGNGLGDAWSIDEVVDGCELLADSGVTQVVLVDDAGLATPKLLEDVLSDVRAVHEELEVGLELHAVPERAEALVRAAYGAGCRRFHGTLGGFGGVTPTGELVRVLGELGAELPSFNPLEGLQAAAAEIARKYSPRVQ